MTQVTAILSLSFFLSCLQCSIYYIPRLTLRLCVKSMSCTKYLLLLIWQMCTLQVHYTSRIIDYEDVVANAVGSHYCPVFSAFFSWQLKWNNVAYILESAEVIAEENMFVNESWRRFNIEISHCQRPWWHYNSAAVFIWLLLANWVHKSIVSSCNS